MESVTVLYTYGKLPANQHDVSTILTCISYCKIFKNPGCVFAGRAGFFGQSVEIIVAGVTVIAGGPVNSLHPKIAFV